LKRFSRNFISILGSDIARRILGMLTIAYLARTIGVENFGLINIGFAVLSYSMIISSLGLSTFGIREVAQGKTENLINKVLSVKLIISFLVYIIVALVALILLDKILARIILIFCLSVFTNAVLLDWYFQGKERMEIVGSARLLSVLVYISTILIFVHTPADIIWVAFASFTGDFVATITYWIFYKIRFGKERFQFVLKGWTSLVKSSIPLGFGIIVATLSTNFPTFVLGIVMTNYDVGIYSAANKLVFFLLMLDRAIATVLLPAASRLHSFSPDEFKSTLSTAMKWIIISALPICVGGTVLSDKIISIIFGSQYIEAVKVFQILIWYFLATMIHTIYTSGLIAVGKEKFYSKIMGFSGIIYAVSIIFMTIYFGIIGAAIAMVISETATMLLMQRGLKRFMNVPLPKSLACIILASLTMGMVVYFFPVRNLFILIVLGCLIYFGVLFLLRAISLNELKNLFAKI